MFFARQEAPDPVRSALRSLRPSMNTPVVVVEDLPAGPASAAIACLGGPGAPSVALAIRSERSGQVIFFGPDDELREWQGPDLALDAALSFAESMGFLFEDDRVAEAPAEARRLWERLLDAGGTLRAPLGDPPRAARVEPPSPGPTTPAPDPEELWLERVEPPDPAVGAGVPLTKFRRPAGAALSPRGEAPPASGSPLARVAPRRRLE